MIPHSLQEASTTLKGSVIRLSDADQRIRRRELYLSQYYNFGHGDATDSAVRSLAPWLVFSVIAVIHLPTSTTHPIAATTLISS